MFLLTFAIVALFVGSFVIYNTFSITVAQRTKETALLRAIGAKRKQVMRSVMLEALVTGVFASAIGVVAGIVTAKGLATGVHGLRFRPAGRRHRRQLEHDRHLDGRRHVVTVLAAYLPARRAAKVAPIAALRDVVGRPHRHVGARAPSSARSSRSAGAAFIALGPVGRRIAGRSVSVRWPCSSASRCSAR